MSAVLRIRATVEMSLVTIIPQYKYPVAEYLLVGFA